MKADSQKLEFCRDPECRVFMLTYLDDRKEPRKVFKPGSVARFISGFVVGAVFQYFALIVLSQ